MCRYGHILHATLSSILINYTAKLRRWGKDVVAVSYTATQDATCEGKKMPPKVYATSVYVRQKGTWLQTRYQETPID